jgi:hypothetical protein
METRQAIYRATVTTVGAGMVLLPWRSHVMLVVDELLDIVRSTQQLSNHASPARRLERMEHGSDLQSHRDNSWGWDTFRVRSRVMLVVDAERCCRCSIPRNVKT